MPYFEENCPHLDIAKVASTKRDLKKNLLSCQIRWILRFSIARSEKKGEKPSDFFIWFLVYSSEMFSLDVLLQWRKRELRSLRSSRHVPTWCSSTVKKARTLPYWKFSRCSHLRLSGRKCCVLSRADDKGRCWVFAGSYPNAIAHISLSSSSPWRWQPLLDLPLGYFVWKRRHRFNALPVLLHQVSPSRRLKYFYKLVTVWAS